MTRRSMLTLGLAACSGCAPSDPIEAPLRRLLRHAMRKAPSQPGDWLTQHKEAGQTYRQFREIVKTPAIDNYTSLRLVPIGSLSSGQSQVIQVVWDFLAPFFGLKLVQDPPVSIDDIPEQAQRVPYFEGPRQLLTTHLLNVVLTSRRQPSDAAVLGITAMDLWPGAGWNFVFGQASLRERVGVWSMARNGDPDESEEMRRLCALRTAMTAGHETGHMFGIRHCVAYECGMNGSNNVEERDRQPLEFCAECQAKLWWTLRLEPLERTKALEVVARRHGYVGIADAWARQAAVLRG